MPPRNKPNEERSTDQQRVAKQLPRIKPRKPDPKDPMSNAIRWLDRAAAHYDLAQSRYILSKIIEDRYDGKRTLVTTDTHRMFMYPLGSCEPSSVQIDYETGEPPVVPLMVTEGSGKNTYQVWYGDRTPATFPSWRRVVPTTEQWVTVQVGELTKAVRRLMRFGNNRIYFRVNPESLWLGTTKDEMIGRESLPAKTTSHTMDLVGVVDGNYLLDSVTIYNRRGSCKLGFCESKDGTVTRPLTVEDPALETSGPWSVLMPMGLDKLTVFEGYDPAPNWLALVRNPVTPAVPWWQTAAIT